MSESVLNQQFRQQLFQFSLRLAAQVTTSAMEPRASLTSLAHLESCNRRTIRSVCVSFPVVMIVLEGQNILNIDNQATVFEVGNLVLIPQGLTLELINQPSAAGQYHALVLEFPTRLLDRFRRAYPEQAHSPTPEFNADQLMTLNLSLTPEPLLVEALLHLMRGLLQRPALSPQLHEHHLMEVMMLLLQSDIKQLALQSIYPDLVTQIRYLIRANLSADWSLERLAQSLDMSISTVKRRLQDVNSNYRQLLDEERMQKAMEMLMQTEQTITQVALACGYRSQSRFAARFRKHYGISPSDARLVPLEPPPPDPSLPQSEN